MPDQSQHPTPPPTCTAFEGFQIVAQGTKEEVRADLKKLRALRDPAEILVFDNQTGETFDLEGSRPPIPETAPSEAPKPARPGRPRLGVVAREVTLLPRHWEWLESQPGGASVALRKLVEAARKEKAPEDRARCSIEATYRFLSVLCGNLPGFEETARSLFRRNWPEFDRLALQLPPDVRRHLQRLSAEARPTLDEPVEITRIA